MNHCEIKICLRIYSVLFAFCDSIFFSSHCSSGAHLYLQLGFSELMCVLFIDLNCTIQYLHCWNSPINRKQPYSKPCFEITISSSLSFGSGSAINTNDVKKPTAVMNLKFLMPGKHPSLTKRQQQNFCKQQVPYVHNTSIFVGKSYSSLLLITIADELVEYSHRKTAI